MPLSTTTLSKPLLLLCILGLSACQSTQKPKTIPPIFQQQARWEMLQSLKHPLKEGLDGAVFLEMHIDSRGVTQSCEVLPLTPTRWIPNPPPANPALEDYVRKQCSKIKFGPILTQYMMKVAAKENKVTLRAPLVFTPLSHQDKKPIRQQAQPSSQ